MATAPASNAHDLPGLLRRMAERALGPGPVDAVGPPRGPDRMLAGLLDIAAAVRVADHLAIHPPLEGPSRAADATGTPLRNRVDRKVREIRAEMTTAFLAPFEGKRAAPSVETVRRVLVETNAVNERQGEAVAKAARALAPEVRDRFDFQLQRGRQRVRWIRVDVTAEIRSLGPDAQRLESLDSVITRATEPSLQRLQRSLEKRLDDCFARALAHAVRALPTEGDPLEAVATWVAPRGFLAGHVHDLGALAIALVDHDIDALTALVDTAWALRSQEINA